jgi:hypothetical protein
MLMALGALLPNFVKLLFSEIYLCSKDWINDRFTGKLCWVECNTHPDLVD